MNDPWDYLSTSWKQRTTGEGGVERWKALEEEEQEWGAARLCGRGKAKGKVGRGKLLLEDGGVCNMDKWGDGSKLL